VAVGDHFGCSAFQFGFDYRIDVVFHQRAAVFIIRLSWLEIVRGLNPDTPSISTEMYILISLPNHACRMSQRAFYVVAFFAPVLYTSEHLFHLEAESG